MILFCCLFILSIISVLALNWNQPSNPLLYDGKQGIAVGYFNTSIWLIGGNPSETDLIEYNIDNDLYIQHNSISTQIYTSSQSYTQIGNIVYLYSYKTQMITTYNMKSNVYNNVAITKPDDRRYPCLTNFGEQYLFLLGGYLNGVYLNDFRIFDLIQNEWINDGTSMPQKRRDFSCDIHNDILYIFGGYDGTKSLDSVITLNINNVSNMDDEWITLLSTLTSPKYNIRSVVYDDYIYIIGGGGRNAQYLDEVDVIDTTTNSIYLDSTLNTARYKTAAVIVNDYNKIFVFGGFNFNKNGGLDTREYSLLNATSSTTIETSTPQYITVIIAVIIIFSIMCVFILITIRILVIDKRKQKNMKMSNVEGMNENNANKVDKKEIINYNQELELEEANSINNEQKNIQTDHSTLGSLTIAKYQKMKPSAPVINECDDNKLQKHIKNDEKERNKRYIKNNDKFKTPQKEETINIGNTTGGEIPKYQEILPSAPVVVDNDDINKQNEESKHNEKQMDNYNDMECVVCMDNPRSFICIPCCHLVLCEECKDLINSKCPICQQQCTFSKLFK
eukprot:198386_1